MFRVTKDYVARARGPRAAAMSFIIVTDGNTIESTPAYFKERKRWLLVELRVLT